jgi:hypothetical protein
MLELKRKIMITKVRKRLLIGLSFIICHLSFSVALTSCADYNVTDDFTAEPDPSYVEPYLDLDPVKSYIDREKYPNLKLGATMKVSEFNKQELAHAACVTNCDDVSFGTTLMAGSIINGKGVMNFLDMSDLLSHVEEIGYEVYGSPIVANANQPDEWLALLTAPIEVTVEYIEVKAADYATIDEFTGTVEKGKAEIVKYDGANALKIGTACNVRIIEGFEVDPAAKYTTTFWAKVDKDASYTVTFSGNKVNGSGADGKFTLKAGKLTKVVIESQSAPDETEGYLRIENTRSAPIYISKVEVGCYPDNHRPQTEKEKSDTIQYALHTWCDGLMKINEGRITSFDLIDEAIDEKAVMDNGKYDLKHSTEKIYWQDILGSDNYAPAVSKEASEAYVKYSGDPAQLKFFISETGLENEKKFESLMYWINIWDAKGAKIDGINAKLNLVYSEDAATLEENNDILDNLLMNLALSGKLVRVSNFDIKYQNADGNNVAAKDITAEQRQKLADYNAYVISSYMTIIPKDKQAGICKGNLADTSDPVGLWSVDTKSKDWVRTATYKAFCDGLTAK